MNRAAGSPPFADMTTRDRFPSLLRDPGFNLADGDEGAQRGTGLRFRHGGTVRM